MVFVKYAVYTVCTIYIVWWMVGAVRRKEKHEFAMALGAWLFITLCFESFSQFSGLEYWTVAPTTATNVLGFVFLGVSGLIFLVTVQTMRRLGKPEKGWEETTTLVETGIFSVVRHPIYFSSLLAVLGVFLLKIFLVSVVVTPAAGVLFFLSARWEDTYNERKFGPAYAEYRKRTRLFVPFLY